MKSQPRFLNRSQRKAPLVAALVLYDHSLPTRFPFDSDDLDLIRPSAGSVARHIRRNHRRASDEPPPVRRISQRPFQSGRRDLESVFALSEPVFVQPLLDCPGSARAVLDEDLLTPLPLDPNIHHWAPLRAPELYLEKF